VPCAATASSPGTSDVVDAAAVITALGMDDRERLREGLAAALLRRSGQRQVYDDLFDIWFPAALGTAHRPRRRHRADTARPGTSAGPGPRPCVPTSPLRAPQPTATSGP
jgi:uncharacterized protein with von Willebrand factor type A (vWA) domain